MAVLIPVVAATAASAAGFSAVAVAATAIAAGAVSQATGVSQKVDNAFGKVFGKDLTQLGNVAGAAFLAFGGADWLAGTGGSALADPSAGLSDPATTIAQTGNGAETIGAPTQPTPDVNPLDGRLSAGTAKTPEGPLAPAVDTNPIKTGNVNPPGNVNTPSTTADQSLTDRVANWWNRADPRTQAALVQVAGGTLSGVAQGYMGASAAADQRDWEERQAGIYRSGSGGVLAPNPLYTSKRKVK